MEEEYDGCDIRINDRVCCCWRVDTASGFAWYGQGDKDMGWKETPSERDKPVNRRSVMIRGFSGKEGTSQGLAKNTKWLDDTRLTSGHRLLSYHMNSLVHSENESPSNSPSVRIRCSYTQLRPT